MARSLIYVRISVGFPSSVETQHDLQTPYEVAHLPRATLGVLEPRPHVNDRTAVLIKPIEYAIRGGQWYEGILWRRNIHFACKTLYSDLLGRYELGFVFSPPEQSALNAFFAVCEVPFGRAHVPGHGVRLVQPPLLPRVVRIRFGQGQTLCVLRRTSNMLYTAAGILTSRNACILAF